MISLKTESGSKAIILYMLYVVVCVCVGGGLLLCKGLRWTPSGPSWAAFPILLGEGRTWASYSWTCRGEGLNCLVAFPFNGELIRMAFTVGDKQTPSAPSTLTLDVNCWHLLSSWEIEFVHSLRCLEGVPSTSLLLIKLSRWCFQSGGIIYWITCLCIHRTQIRDLGAS